jgi:poly(3-hydroxybutyrate) depolymerase
LFVPEKKKGPFPLVILLHGSGRNGNSLVEKWKDLASREGFIIAGPDATDIQQWKTPDDGPILLLDLVTELEAKYTVDKRRVYLFGHSAGAVFALNMSMLESKYFAAVAIHAGAWRDPREFTVLAAAKRKIPIAIVVGDIDQYFPLAAVNATSSKLKENGFQVDLTIMKGHDHWYYDLASKINQGEWDFLKKYQLDEDPVFEKYTFDQ